MLNEQKQKSVTLGMTYTCFSLLIELLVYWGIIQISVPVILNFFLIKNKEEERVE